jgi:hypothetical protein
MLEVRERERGIFGIRVRVGDRIRMELGLGLEVERSLLALPPWAILSDGNVRGKD